ncbi:hypothetical protein QQ054_02910 [Oscillatoria amoena NRMC-F 0135]|nr:hypothetical protein [Oscillatoria amoena NRMC-F 0135]
MNKIITLLGCAVSVFMLLSSCKDLTKPIHTETCNWPGVEYATAKAFMIADSERYLEAIEQGKRVDSLIAGAEVWEVTKEVAEKLSDVFCKPIDKNKVRRVADCFVPRHGVIFYDASGNYTAHVTICFECNHYKVYPAPKNIDIEALKSWCKELGMPVFDRDDKYHEYFKQRKKAN